MWRFMKILFRGFLTVSILLLAACASDNSPNPYLSTKVGKNLELPPDLQAEKQESKYALPAGFIQISKEEDALPVLVAVDSIQLMGGEGFYWLKIEETPEDVYKLIKQFWASEGYPLILEEPLLGIMQTDWNYRDVGTKRPELSFWENIFFINDYSASQDQFKTRIEKSANKSMSKVYITHRGADLNYRLLRTEQDRAKANENQWLFRRSEPELEVEMLSRLLVYLGVQQAQMKQQLDNLKVYPARASLHRDVESSKNYLLMPYDQLRAWHRVLHQLERLNLNLDYANFNQDFDDEGLISVISDIQIDNSDKNVFSFFSEESETANKVFTISVTAETHRVSRIELRTEEGENDDSKEANDFINLLLEFLK
jgi:outer membrane protein assembly factor BamC